MANIMKDNSEVRVPLALLEASGLTTSAKLIWMVLALLDAIDGKQTLTQTQLGDMLGFCRQTVARALADLEALGWYAVDTTRELAGLGGPAGRPCGRCSVPVGPPVGGVAIDAGVRQRQPSDTGSRAEPALQQSPGPTIAVPAALLLDTSLAAGVKLMRIELQGVRARMRSLKFSYASLSEKLGRGVKSVRRAVKQLVLGNWLRLEQPNRQAPMAFTVLEPIREFWARMLERIVQHLNAAEYVGEAIAMDLLSIVVDLETFVDNAYPDYLVNPLTGRCMQLDRDYYEDNIAFEYQGTQHTVATEWYGEKTVKAQRIRDAIKRDILEKLGKKLIALYSHDLSIEAIQLKVAGLLPFRDLTGPGADAVIRFMEAVCEGYRAKCPPPTVVQ